MVRHASLFSQLVSLFNRQRFYELVYRHRSERYAKGFSSWDQFVAMLFCQLAQAKSLREISGGLASALGKLRHLGVKSAPGSGPLTASQSASATAAPLAAEAIRSLRPFPARMVTAPVSASRWARPPGSGSGSAEFRIDRRHGRACPGHLDEGSFKCRGR